jgi:Flp pilus assembly CpaF family ATPase
VELSELRANVVNKKVIDMITLNDLISNGSISEKDSSFLIEKLKNKSNIIVIGQSNSGKTTLVKALIKAAIYKCCGH